MPNVMRSMDTSVIALPGLLARRKPDRELLAAALDGDSVAFSEVYRRFSSRIHGFCLARLGDSETAEDATQEVFLRVLRNGPADIENPPAWLYAIARNVVVDAHRAATRRPVASEIGEDALVIGARVVTGAHDGVELGEDVSAVMLAMRALAPRYRAAIVMRDIKGLTSAEAAEAIRTSTGTLDTLLHRARRALVSEHARVEGLPKACRHASAILYAADQAIVPEREREALEVHLLGCERCRAERSRIKRRRALQAFFPFLFPAERAADAISRLALATAHPVAGVAAVGLAAALALAPIGVARLGQQATATAHSTAAATVSADTLPVSVPALALRLTAPANAEVVARIAASCAGAAGSGPLHTDAQGHTSGHSGPAATMSGHTADPTVSGGSGIAGHTAVSSHPSEPDPMTAVGPGSDPMHH